MKAIIVIVFSFKFLNCTLKHLFTLNLRNNDKLALLKWLIVSNLGQAVLHGDIRRSTDEYTKLLNVVANSKPLWQFPSAPQNPPPSSSSLVPSTAPAAGSSGPSTSTALSTSSTQINQPSPLAHPPPPPPAMSTAADVAAQKSSIAPEVIIIDDDEPAPSRSLISQEEQEGSRSEKTGALIPQIP